MWAETPEQKQKREMERYAMYEEDRRVEARFFEDIKDHQMEVLKDEGLYRHLKFSKPGTNAYRFDLVTFPGYMVVTGDMGSYTFTRVPDMFEFFRTDRKSTIPARMGLKLHTSRGYWAQKLCAINCSGASSVSEVSEFDREKYIAWVRKERLRWIVGGKQCEDLTKEQRRELWDEIQEQVLDHAEEYDSEDLVVVKAYEFSWSPDGTDRNRYHFDEMPSFKKPSYHYMWICNAIAWGVEHYDANKEVYLPRFMEVK